MTPPSSEKQKFIKEYADFIAELGKKLNLKIWPATWISSRDGFSSQFNEIALAVFFKSKKDATDLISAQPAVITVLKKAVTLARVTARYIKYVLFYSKKSQGLSDVTATFAKADLSLIKTFAGQRAVVGKTKFEDPYFQELKTFLDSKNIKNLTIVDSINAVKEFSALSNLKEGTVSLFSCLTTTDILKAYVEILYSAFYCFLNWPEDTTFHGKNLSYAAFKQTVLEICSDETLHCLCIEKAFSNLCSKLSVKSVYLTLEFHPWEKLAWRAIRKASPQTRILSHQHSILNESMIHFFQTPEDLSTCGLPDRILTTGKINESLLVKSNYGSIVEEGAALRFKYLEKLPPLEFTLEKTILVALCGVHSVNQLFDFAVNLAKAHPQWTFIFREHPMIPIRNIKSPHTEAVLSGKISNIRLSKYSTVAEDLKLASFVLYRTSSIGLEALKMGRPSLHFVGDDIFSLDSAENCKGLHFQINNLKDFEATTKEITSAHSEGKMAKLKAETDLFMQEYFTVIDEKSLSRFL